ncbi:MAG TPA: VOC family protein [Terriglobia bacterium]|nr:VOC family protein [Terriglobia bacterium]
MTTSQTHPSGSFCWVELSTSDQNAAKKFYSGLFGWSINDNPMGPGEAYTIFRLGGRDAAAAYTMNKQEREAHVPPHWNLYIATENVDNSASRVAKTGGTVLGGPFDVMDAGRMAVVKDPTGAAFCLWQAKNNSGLGVTGEDGAFCWADLNTPDPQRAGKFYSDLLGWKLEKGANDASGYLHIKNGDKHIGGIPPAQYLPKGAPAHWLIYFHVAGVEASTDRVSQMGGKVHMPPQNMPNVGAWSVVADPQGAAFALFKAGR